MLEFVAETAAKAGSRTTGVVNVGPGGGQTVFHLHWHVWGRSLPDSNDADRRDRG
jgi:diadenosine tetraphosphate (Ap4A) HIT family hydrolase